MGYDNDGPKLPVIACYIHLTWVNYGESMVNLWIIMVNNDESMDNRRKFRSETSDNMDS